MKRGDRLRVSCLNPFLGWTYFSNAYMVRTIPTMLAREPRIMSVQQFPETSQSQTLSGIPTCLFVNHHAKMGLS